MTTHRPDEDPFLSFWLRVREFAVPPSMIETATARRRTGDWAGACAAAGVDVDFTPRALARTYGRELAARVRADLRHLAPDLLRWHMPRIAPRGLLRPGLTIALARYDSEPRPGTARAPAPVHLVARTPPAWADAGQRISLGLWDGTGPGTVRLHPHPYPSRRFRLDLHRHLWDARHAADLRVRAEGEGGGDSEILGQLPPGRRCAAGRWAAEAALLLDAEGRTSGPVTVRLGGRHRLLLHATAEGRLRLADARTAAARTPLVLPDAATWALPDLELLRSGAIEADRLHPLVAAALAAGHAPAGPPPAPAGAGHPRVVDCRGAPHRIGLVDGVLSALDHDPAEVRREELLVALTGTPLPCLRAIDEAHRRPDCLTGVRERLDHGDIAGALAVVEGLLGPGAQLRDGPLRDELETAALRRITYGLYRADLIEPGPSTCHPVTPPAPARRTRPRRAGAR
ncbi:hypothetical protein [Streptomyces sp. NBC_00523]|uniref:hypothetical protein n=1 Tax=unclassified Streptomyces TaxID=2593676 RepID=UPI002E7FB7CB|nr:hypothetical protein [Streptomyces sp. NBC_00523]WUD03844.1 hypothetical protein OHS17_31195 [Streptomyces sp. NBC_00523]